MPSLVAFTVTAGPSMTSTVSSPALMPFLALPLTVSLPVPVMTQSAPALTLMAAPSKASATAVSVEVSSSGFSLSVSLTVPEMTTFTWLSLLMERVAPVVLVRSRSSRISTTPVTPFLTVMLPSAALPVMR